MELWAAGFNAWGQLDVEKGGPGNSGKLHNDFPNFTKVLSDDQIFKIWASLSATRVESSSGVYLAGFFEGWWTTRLGLRIFEPTVTITGSGEIAVYSQKMGSVSQYADEKHYLDGKVSRTIEGLGDIIQIVAYATGFAALSAEGEVVTWGSEQCLACLGRLVEDSWYVLSTISIRSQGATLIESSPASLPGTVTDLMELPTGKITKIAAGGHLVMALTEGSDLYAWGGHPGLRALFQGLSADPTPIDIDNNDVADFAVGANHAVVLTQDGELFVVGDNRNGQLGLPLERAESWSRVPLALEPGRKISAVACGPHSTFVITC